MNKITTPLLLIAAVGVIGTAQAQNAKPAAETITMNKQMTREELRACMKLQDDIKTAAASIEADKAKLQEDKLKLTGGGNSEQLKALKADMEAKLAEAKALDEASADHAKRVEAWNAEWKEAQESTMRSAEKKRKDLESERKEMDSRMRKLQGERDARIAAYNAAAERYKALAGTGSADAVAWNKRNEALADRGDELLEMRSTYSAECANRKFDERDEQAIKKGK